MNGWFWEKFQLVELVEIVQQSKIQIMLNYLKEFENVSKQIMMCFKKKALANNDTAT